jgi:ketosteroid isomerase-like protein
MLTEDFQDPGFSLDLQELRTIVSAGGDFACTRGTFHLDFTNPQSSQSESVAGSYVQVFRVNPSGSWEVVEDISSPGPTDSSPG